ncbi:hypothetical protein NG819_04625 [Pseudarthrobacter sp. Fe7]|nr:hypothetical protein NG819_04625 [Pseudarthrobacter sp. Fe7]
MSLKTTEAATGAEARLAPKPEPRDYRSARTLAGLRKNTPGLIVLVILGVLIVLPLPWSCLRHPRTASPGRAASPWAA